MSDLSIWEKKITAVDVYERGALDGLLGRIETEARSVIADVGTSKGRKQIAAIANKVARSKTHLDQLGKNLTADFVESERDGGDWVILHREDGGAYALKDAVLVGAGGVEPAWEEQHAANLAAE